MTCEIGCHRVCNYRNTSKNSKVSISLEEVTLDVLVVGETTEPVVWDCANHNLENEIAGDVLVHLDHDALKDLDVSSVGHRLYLLKQIYNLKIAHGVKIEKDDYVPICISPPKI